MSPRKDLILAVNAGSSSLKISLFSLSGASVKHDNATESPAHLIVNSSIDKISSPPATFTFSYTDPNLSSRNIKKQELGDAVKDHSSAFAHFLERLKEEGGVERHQIRHVCHRVVHGGDYTEPVIVSKESYHHLENLTNLAPL
jgi:acetate kinase